MGKKGEPRTKHGMSKSSEFVVWWSMLQRCSNPKHASYTDYGGRGISVCERWQQFENFIHDLGARPSLGHSLDRINVGGNYEPENCRWATAYEQSRNTRRNVVLTVDGKSAVLKDWCIAYGISPNTVRHRIRKLGLPPEEALTVPAHAPCRVAASGARGVYRHPARAKAYQAKIALSGGKYKSLGYYVTVEEASRAYQAAQGMRRS